MARDGSSSNKGRHAFISQLLQKGRTSQRLICRVCRLWKTYNPNQPSELMSLDFVVIDEKGDAICCVVRTRYIPEFELLLREGAVYVFKNYFVTPVKPDYHIIHDRGFYLVFDSSSSIDEMVANVPEIAPHAFSIVPYENLATTGADRINLCDVIGIATSVSDIGVRICKDVRTKVQNFELTDLRGEVLKVTAWGDDCTGQASALAGSRDRVWIITSTIVKYDMRGDLYVSTSSASRFFNSVEIDEIQNFINGLPDNGIGAELKHTKMYSPYVMRSEFDKWFRTNAQVQEMLALDSKFEDPLFIRGTIKSIAEHNGWRYNSCTWCRKKVKIEGDKYFCTTCAKYESEPVLRYRIEIVVDDGDTSVDCVMFDREVDKVVPIKCPDLADKVIEEDADEAIPRPISRIIGKSYIFKLRYNDYGRDYQRDTFTVIKLLFESDIKNDDEIVGKADTSLPSIPSSNQELALKTPAQTEKRRRYNQEDDCSPSSVDDRSDVAVQIVEDKNGGSKKSKRNIDFSEGLRMIGTK